MSPWQPLQVVDDGQNYGNNPDPEQRPEEVPNLRPKHDLLPLPFEFVVHGDLLVESRAVMPRFDTVALARVKIWQGINGVDMRIEVG